MSCENKEDLKNIKLKDGDKVLFHDLEWFKKNWTYENSDGMEKFIDKETTFALFVDTISSDEKSMDSVLGKWFHIKDCNERYNSFKVIPKNPFVYNKVMISDVIIGEENVL